jgi:hypothetical protein
VNGLKCSKLIIIRRKIKLKTKISCKTNQPVFLYTCIEVLNEVVMVVVVVVVVVAMIMTATESYK